MYLSLRDRPAARRSRGASPEELRAEKAARRTKVSSVVVTLGVVSMLTDISSESVAAVLPLYVTTALGLSTLAYGFLDGLMQGASALVRIAGGWAADRGDHPKWVAVDRLRAVRRDPRRAARGQQLRRRDRASSRSTAWARASARPPATR